MVDEEDPNLEVEINGYKITQGFEGNGTPLTRDQLNHLVVRLCQDQENLYPTCDDFEAAVRLNFLAVQFKDVPKYINYLKGIHEIILKYRLEVGA